MVTNSLDELRDAGMIEMKGPGDIKATEIGKSMAKFCVCYWLIICEYSNLI